jgi:hypothetical protein
MRVYRITLTAMQPSNASILLWIVLSMGCSRLSKETVAKEALPSPAADAAIVAVPRATVRPLRGVCVARTGTPDPGPTKARPSSLGGPPISLKDECLKHVDCKEAGHGRCVSTPASSESNHGTWFETPAHNTCVYDECLSDEECRKSGDPQAIERVCLCNSIGRNTCGFANCREDTDCPTGFPCGTGAYCHAPEDECRLDADCPSAKKKCGYEQAAKKYTCKAPYTPFPG